MALADALVLAFRTSFSMSSEFHGMRINPIRVVLLSLVAMSAAHAQVERGNVPPDALGVDKDRNEVHVSDYRGKVVVLTFWASWCGYCLKELPVLENVQRKVGAERIAVVAINTDMDAADYRAMRRRMKDFQITMTADRRDANISKDYGVKGLPHMVMVDKKGEVAYTHVGYSVESLDGFVDEINGLIEE